MDTTSQLHFQLDLGNDTNDSDSDEEEGKSSSKTESYRATTLDEVMSAFVEARERIELLLGAS